MPTIRSAAHYPAFKLACHDPAPGKATTGKEISGHLRRLVLRIRARWPTTRILVPGDGHYGCAQTRARRHSHSTRAQAQACAARLCRDTPPGEVLEGRTPHLRGSRRSPRASTHARRHQSRRCGLLRG
ncbi:hypothetical protein EN792_074210, partial [Mesorhizobium sp. M00.F.Ca.ET.149.01.1.1]